MLVAKSGAKSHIVMHRAHFWLLAQVFKDLGIIEKYGAGVKRVIEDFRAYGLVDPIFEEKFGGFYVVVSDGKLNSGTTQEIGKTTQEIHTHVGPTKKGYWKINSG